MINLYCAICLCHFCLLFNLSKKITGLSRRVKWLCHTIATHSVIENRSIFCSFEKLHQMTFSRHLAETGQSIHKKKNQNMKNNDTNTKLLNFALEVSFVGLQSVNMTIKWWNTTELHSSDVGNRRFIYSLCIFTVNRKELSKCADVNSLTLHAITGSFRLLYFCSWFKWDYFRILRNFRN